MLRIIGILILTQIGFAQQVQEGSPYSRIQGLDNNYHIIIFLRLIQKRY